MTFSIEEINIIKPFAKPGSDSLFSNQKIADRAIKISDKCAVVTTSLLALNMI